MLRQDFVLCTAIAVHFYIANYAKDMTCCLQLAETLLSIAVTKYA